MSLTHIRAGAARIRLIEAEMDKLFDSGASPETVWNRIRSRVPGITVDELELAGERTLRRRRLMLAWEWLAALGSLSIVRIAAIIAIFAAIIMGAF